EVMFCQLLGQLHTGNLAARLPLAVEHLPVAGRAYDPIAPTRSLSMIRFMTSVAAEHDVPIRRWQRAAPGELYRSLGRHCSELAALPPTSFRELAHYLRWTYTSQDLAMTTLQYELGAGPAFWRRHIEEHRVALKTSLDLRIP